jgi:hypothetical protein
MKILIKEQQLENLAFHFVLDKLKDMDFMIKKNKEFSFFPKTSRTAENGIEADWVKGEGYDVLVGNTLWRSVQDMFNLTNEQVQILFIKAFIEFGIKKFSNVSTLDFSAFNHFIDREVNESVLVEQFDPERLYPKQEIIRLLKGAPRELKEISKNLPNIPCENDKGERTICTKIPETIHVYLTGRY